MSLQLRNPSSGVLEKAAGYNDTDLILSPDSMNPIASKTVYNALAQKVEKTVDDLVNYYTTAQTYNKQQVRELIGAINTLTISVVASLPTSDISSTTIYFVGPAAGTNTYDEYVYVNNSWVKIGDTQIDLTQYVTSASLTTALQSYYTKTAVDALLGNYYTKTEADTALNAKQDNLTFDETPTANSANPVKSGGVKAALDLKANASDMTTALNGKQNTLTFDNTPTANSSNPVTSGGVKAAIDNVTNLIPATASTSNKLATAQDVAEAKAMAGATGVYTPYICQFKNTGNVQRHYGAIKIHTGQSINNQMRKFTVDIFDWTSNSTATYQMSSYIYSGGPYNRECTAVCVAGTGRAAHRKVRFGYETVNGVNQGCFWIGEVDSVLEFPAIVVRDGLASYSNNNAEQAFKNFSIEFVTSFDNDTVLTTITT